MSEGSQVSKVTLCVEILKWHWAGQLKRGKKEEDKKQDKKKKNKGKTKCSNRSPASTASKEERGDNPQIAINLDREKVV